MKRFLALMLSFLMVLIPVYARAGWLDDWIQQQTYSGPDYFEGQKRGYFTAGSFSTRWSTGREYPITITLPRYSYGCGGIDVFMGGMTFAMLPEYLVQKLQALISASPAIAFEVALAILSEVLSDKVNVVKSIIDRLNDIQLDDCKIQQGVILTAKELAHSKKLSSAISEFLTQSGIKDTYHQVVGEKQGEQVSESDARRAIEGCPTDLKNLLNGGSLVRWALSQSGFSDSLGLANYVRGLIGDVIARNQAFVYEEGCPQLQTKGELDAFIGEERYYKTESGQCVRDTSPIVIAGRSYGSLLEWAQASIEDLAQSVQSESHLSDSTRQFLRMVPAPIYRAVLVGIQAGDYRANAALYAKIAATAVAYRILSAVQGSGIYAAAVIQKVMMAQGNSPKEDCKPEVLQALSTAVKSFMENATIAVRKVKLAYAGELQEANTILAQADLQMKFMNMLIEGLSRAAMKNTSSS